MRQRERISIRVRSKLKWESSDGGHSGFVWVDDISTGGARVTFPPESSMAQIQPILGRGGTLRINNRDIEFTTIHAMDHLGTPSVGIKFEIELSKSELEGLLSNDSSEDENEVSIITFKTISDISELSLYEAIRQQISLCLIIDISYQIQAEMYAQQNKRDLIFVPPKYTYLRSGSPLKGAIEATKKVIDIIKVADDLLKNRPENKELKNQEVIQAQEKARQEIQISDRLESDAFIKRNTRNYEIIQKQMSLIETKIELKKEEITLIREQLSLAKDVFGENSPEFKLFKDGLMPRLLAIGDDSPFRLDLTYVESTDSEE